MQLMLLWLVLMLQLLLLLMLLHMMLHHCGHRWQPHILQRGATAALHQARRRLAAAHGNYIKVFDCVNKIKCEKRREKTWGKKNKNERQKGGEKEKIKGKAKTIDFHVLFNWGIFVFVFVCSIHIQN